MRMMAACCMFGVAMAACPTRALARDDAQLWLTGAATVRIGDRWRFSQEVIVRLSDNRAGLSEIESNSLLGYRLAPRLTVWAGYTHDPTYDGGRLAAMERRAREQVTLEDIRLGPARAMLRLRTEQRWRDGLDGTGWRVRPFVRIAVPLHAQGATGIAFSHESFINLNRNAFQTIAGEDRMRNALALYTPVAKGVNVELGYLNQYRFATGAAGGSDHAATASINLSFR